MLLTVLFWVVGVHDARHRLERRLKWQPFVCNIELALAVNITQRFGAAVIPMIRLLCRCANLVLEVVARMHVGFAKELINGLENRLEVAVIVADYRAVVQNVISLNMLLIVLFWVVNVHGARHRLERRLQWLWWL